MRRYIIAAAVAIPLLGFLFLAAGYASDEMIGTERVGRGVTAAGMNVSRLTSEDVTGLIAAHEASLASQPLTVIVEGNELLLDPADTGFEIDEASVAAEAMTVRRSEDLMSNLRLWTGSFTSTIEIDVPTTIDEEAIAGILAEWTATVLDTPAYEGTVKIENGRAVPEYPQAGLRIDVEAAIPLLHEQLARSDRTPVVLPLIPLDPVITRADVQQISRAPSFSHRLASQPHSGPRSPTALPQYSRLALTRINCARSHRARQRASPSHR